MIGGNRTLALLLIAILGIALGLRLENIRQPLVDHFSWREASTAMMADNLPKNGWNPLWPEVSWAGDKPGYQGREFQTLTIAAAMLDRAFGWQDWHGRLVAAMMGVISTYALFRLVMLLHGATLALLAAAVYAFLPGAVIIDSSYLPDPAMLALALISLWFLAEGVSVKSKKWMFAGWITGTVAILSKLPALAALPAAIYLVLASGPGARGRLPWLLIAIGASGTIIGSYYAWALYLGSTYPPFHVAGSGWLWDYGFNAFWKEGFYLGTLRWHAVTWLWTPAIIVLAVAGFVATFEYRCKNACPNGSVAAPWFFHTWLFGCAVFYLVAALELRNNSWNLHIFNAPIALFAGVGLALIARIGSLPLSGLTVVGVMVVIFVTGRSGVARIKEDPVGVLDHALGARLEQLSCPSDLVVTSGTDAGSPIAILYSRRRGWVFPPPEHAPGRNYALYNPDGAPALAALDDLVERGGGWFGFVKSGYDKSNPRKIFAEHYSALIGHLRQRAFTAYEDEKIAIFDLAPLSYRLIEKDCRKNGPGKPRHHR
jgi:hypothetical protein